MPDVNGWEFLLLAVLELVILGPEKLPKYAADAGRMIRSVRRMADDAKREVTDSLGPEFRDIDIADLNPRRFARKHLFDPDDLGLDDDLGSDDDATRDERRGARRNGASSGSSTARPAAAGPQPGDEERAPRAAPYDPDAT